MSSCYDRAPLRAASAQEHTIVPQRLMRSIRCFGTTIYVYLRMILIAKPPPLAARSESLVLFVTTIFLIV